MDTGRLVARRTSPQDIQIRELLVQVDDGPEFNLKFGESKELDLPPGEHTLCATNRLFTEKTMFQLSAGETVTFEVGNVANGCLAAFFIGLGMGMYRITLNRVGPA
ncbi:MAG: hypothetical protein QOJ65_900 [Fimbriimonadaceae bacterium]|nr:hypothetical protein [Fimbriimonadaceae bacterium]